MIKGHSVYTYSTALRPQKKPMDGGNATAPDFTLSFLRNALPASSSLYQPDTKELLWWNHRMCFDPGSGLPEEEEGGGRVRLVLLYD
jgi:ABC-type oligopeptide transport system substrate-binding subunit